MFLLQSGSNTPQLAALGSLFLGFPVYLPFIEYQTEIMKNKGFVVFPH
jgi:hypothetical protein